MFKKTVQFYAETRILQKPRESDTILCRETGIRQNIFGLNTLYIFCHNLSNKVWVDKGTYKICLGQNIIVTDSETDSVKARIDGDRFSFIFSNSDNLVYVDDIPKFFRPFEISEPIKNDTLGPVYMKTFDGHAVKYRPLKCKEIFVNKNLYQMWPICTNTFPKALLEFFNCENIREK
ncbi:MAG: hypothetical protein J6S57_03445 [Alphaproteobacteria bacterium]|nr:hypothetical protein [Alphaproteobacteria bacterium]